MALRALGYRTASIRGRSGPSPSQSGAKRRRCRHEHLCGGRASCHADEHKAWKRADPGPGAGAARSRRCRARTPRRAPDARRDRAGALGARAPRRDRRDPSERAAHARRSPRQAPDGAGAGRCRHPPPAHRAGRAVAPCAEARAAARLQAALRVLGPGRDQVRRRAGGRADARLSRDAGVVRGDRRAGAGAHRTPRLRPPAGGRGRSGGRSRETGRCGRRVADERGARGEAPAGAAPRGRPRDRARRRAGDRCRPRRDRPAAGRRRHLGRARGERSGRFHERLFARRRRLRSRIGRAARCAARAERRTRRSSRCRSLDPTCGRGGPPARTGTAADRARISDCRARAAAPP